MGVAIVGARLAELATVVDLVDAGQGKIFESRPLLGGKVSTVGSMQMAILSRWGCMYSLGATISFLI